jgi:uncharacterized membrane protein YqiK
MRLAQSEQWCAYFAKKTALVEAAQTRAELDATKEKAARREAVKLQLYAERREEKASENAEARRLTADAERQAAARARRTSHKLVSFAEDGISRPMFQVQVASRADGGRRRALEEVL